MALNQEETLLKLVQGDPGDAFVSSISGWKAGTNGTKESRLLRLS